jgi:hypothetical protein
LTSPKSVTYSNPASMSCSRSIESVLFDLQLRSIVFGGVIAYHLTCCLLGRQVGEQW